MRNFKLHAIALLSLALFWPDKYISFQSPPLILSFQLLTFYSSFSSTPNRILAYSLLSSPVSSKILHVASILERIIGLCLPLFVLLHYTFTLESGQRQPEVHQCFLSNNVRMSALDKSQMHTLYCVDLFSLTLCLIPS